MFASHRSAQPSMARPERIAIRSAAFLTLVMTSSSIMQAWEQQETVHGRKPRPVGWGQFPAGVSNSRADRYLNSAGPPVHMGETVRGRCLSHIHYVGLILSPGLFVAAKDLFVGAIGDGWPWGRWLQWFQRMTMSKGVGPSNEERHCADADGDHRFSYDEGPERRHNHEEAGHDDDCRLGREEMFRCWAHCSLQMDATPS